MRKRVINGKRMMALALALTMVAGEASVVSAAPADIAIESVDETAETPVEETVSENGTDTEVQQEETNDTEEVKEADEEEVEADEVNYAGNLEKVIGIKGTPSYEAFTDDNGKVKINYTSAYLSKEAIIVAGKLESDKVTGLYSVGTKLYTYASYDEYMNQTKIDQDDEVVILPGTPSSYEDATTGLYLINGLYYKYLDYYTDANGVEVAYYYPNYVVTPIGTYSDYDTMSQTIRKTYGRYTKSAAYYKKLNGNDDIYSYYPDYFEVNGKYYSSFDSRWIGSGKYIAYVNPDDELTFTQEKVDLTWNMQTLPSNAQNAAGKDMYLGYELMINGAVYNQGGTYVYDADGTIHNVRTRTSSNCTPKVLLAAGQTMNVQVRALYYHKENKTITETDGTVYGSNYYYADAYGDWSDVYTYTAANRTAVPAVTSVTAAKVAGYNNVKVTWNAVKEATSYTVYEVASKKAIGISPANFNDFYSNSYDSEFLKNNALEQGDLSRDSDTISDIYGKFGYDDDYMYHYYAVVPNDVADSTIYYNDNSLATIATMSGAVVTRDVSVINTPAISGFKVDANEDGTYDLRWTPVEAKMIVYAYDSAQFPTYYQYRPWSVYRDEAIENSINVTQHNLWSDMTSKELNVVNKVKNHTVDGIDGGLYDVKSKFSLTSGKTYYFVAYTYDATDIDKKKAPIAFTATVKSSKNGVETTETKAYNYEYYMALGAPTATVSAKLALEKPYVCTMPDKTSVKMTMTGNRYTGYEIYRKSGKKYKKITTITNDVYTDLKLKANTKYSYKVRSYSYDRDTKKTYYSDYTFFDIKTGVAATIDLTAVKASTTSVKLKWTKVASASKYEVYRSSSENCDPKILSKKYSAAGIVKALENDRYELVKSISKASTVSYTDKKLTAGENYYYIVVAYYKNGKTTEYVGAGDSVYMGLEAPKNIKAVCSGSKIKVSWDPEKYASKYELEYNVYGKNGSKTDLSIKASTKKTSYTISGIENGGYVEVYVRAYGKNKKYSDWSYAYEAKHMAPVKNIKATVTKVNGKNTVKISWNKVSGAKYYKVRRSTVEGSYYADEKAYGIVGSYIAKESNADYHHYSSSINSEGYRTSNGEVAYEEYNGVANSIVGTSTYDNADLASGVTYYYSVEAYADIPVGGQDSNVYSVLTTKPATIVANISATVKAVNSKKGQVKLTFDKASGVSSYTVYRAVKNGKKVGTFTKIGTAKKSATSYVDKKAKKGKTYVYKVVPNGTNALKGKYTAEMTSAAIKVKK